MTKTVSWCVIVGAVLAFSASAGAQSPAGGGAPSTPANASAPGGAKGPNPAPAGTPTPASGTDTAAAGDPNAGREKTAMCQGCHEIPGWQTAFPETYKVPRIFGQHPAYLVRALQAYRSGERSHPSMRAIAATLTDKDMADLAAFYGGPPVRTAGK